MTDQCCCGVSAGMETSGPGSSGSETVGMVRGMDRLASSAAPAQCNLSVSVGQQSGAQQPDNCQPLQLTFRKLSSTTHSDNSDPQHIIQQR